MDGGSEPSISASSALAIGNFKGIMLCNRPSEGTNSSSERKSFACGVVPEPTGLPVTILRKDRVVVKKDKKDSVLAKHKLWLQELQKTKDRMEIEKELEAKRKADLIQRLAEHSRKQRLFLSESLDSKDNDELGNAKPETDQTEFPVILPELKESEKVLTKAESKSVKTKSSRPAWSLTSDIAKEAEEDCEMADLDGLLEFAQNLEYDKCVGDMETKVLIDQIKKRISELEKDISNEEKLESADAKEIQAKKDQLVQMGNTIATLSIEKKKGDEVYSAAKDVLDNELDLHAIHSMRSVAAMIKSSDPAIIDAQPKVYNEPKTIEHEGKEGVRQGRFDASNLPYLHRNPAV